MERVEHMEPFITEDFVLQSHAARELYHDYAKDMPIIDYHCHLPPQQVSEDTRFANIGAMWLGGDHYKWRQMRSNGISEKYCTGDATDREKFDAWAQTMPKALMNPLYHWTHMELRFPFGISDRVLCPETADYIWDTCNEKLTKPEFSVRGLLKQFDVRIICTTDDPTDTLDAHKAIASDPFCHAQVLPTWRPDKGMAVENVEAFNAWVDLLGERAGMDIAHYAAYLEALHKRHDAFHAAGCRLSDHGLEYPCWANYTETEISAIFGKLRAGKAVDALEAEKFKSALMVEFGVMDANKNWTQQLHFGAIRNNNTAMFEQLGPDTGFDSVADGSVARPLSRLLDALAHRGKLPKTILYNLNPKDNAVMGTMLGNFQDGSIPGKMQWGSGWWFLDTMDGMVEQMKTLGNLGLLSHFVGMLTDSRSYLSFSRHDYFRRILCNLLGGQMELGLIPRDMELVGGMVRDISYNNAARYFGFQL